MNQIEIHRMAAMMTFTDAYGMSPDLAAKAALALHPLDEYPVPARGFEKKIRKASRRYARSLRNMKGRPAEIESLVRRTLASYKTLASEAGEVYYINRFDKALDVDQN